MGKLPPAGTPERLHFIRRMLTDTGFFCRNVLGMDTDRDEHGNAVSDVGKGGVRDWGPHAELIQFLDDDSRKESVILAPRYSYKSSIVQGFILRQILAHPNIAILLYMHDLEIARERCQKIRDILTNNPILQELYPDIQGPKWAMGEFVTSLRTNQSVMSPTLSVASPDKARTGGRYNIILFDDIVSETNFLTELGRKKCIRVMEMSLNLRGRGTRLIDVGTPYHPADAHHWAMDVGWDRLTHLDVGCDLVVKEDGTLGLTGEARWPNLHKAHLESYLKGGMSFPIFMSQFKLQVVAGFNEAFQRHQFQPEQWNDEQHSQLTGYLLTDIAPSGSPRGDFNVLLYVGIDDRNRVYLLDLEIGHWKMYEFCERYLAMLQRWSAKVTHRCELMEDSLNYHSYSQHLHARGRERGIRINIETQKRNQHEKDKDSRIAGLQYRFQAHEVFVMNTIPRAWNTGTEVRELWNAEGYHDPVKGVDLPGGDLVDWFVRFPNHQKKDVPDTLALVDAVDRKTQTRICYHVRPSKTRLTDEVKRKTVRQRKQAETLRGSASRFYERYARR